MPLKAQESLLSTVALVMVMGAVEQEEGWLSTGRTGNGGAGP